MIAMPYILVNIVLGMISSLLFGVTSAALLTALCLRAQPRARRMLAFAALTLGFSVLPIAVVRVLERVRHAYVSPQPFYDLAFCVGLFNSVVLIYRFSSKRYLRNMPKVRRCVVLGALSVLATIVPAFAVVAAVFMLCTIR